MKKQAILALVLTILLITACAAPAEPAPAEPTAEAVPTAEPATPGAEVEVTEPPQGGSAIAVRLVDMLGRTVEIAGVPDTVVSLSPSATETLFALEAQSTLVGVSSDCVYPEEVDAIPEVMTVEDAIALDPKLVFVDGNVGEETIEKLEAAGITAVCAQAQTYQDLYGSIGFTAQIMGKDASALIESMQEGVQAVEDDAQSLMPQTVVCVLGVMDDGGLLTTGENSFVTELMARAGGTPLIADSPEQVATLFEQTLTVEQVLDLNPDVLLVAESCAWNDAWEERPLSLLTAVEDGRMYSISDELIAYAGPRAAETARAIYEALEQAQLS